MSNAPIRLNTEDLQDLSIKRERLRIFYKGKCVICGNTCNGISGWVDERCIVTIKCDSCASSFQIDKFFPGVFRGTYILNQQQFEETALKMYFEGVKEPEVPKIENDVKTIEYKKPKKPRKVKRK